MFLTINGLRVLSATVYKFLHGPVHDFLVTNSIPVLQYLV